MDKKAFILGVSGKVGHALAIYLKERGWQVAGAARFSHPGSSDELRAEGIETFQYDVTRDDPATLPKADVVFLEIWDPSQPDLIWPINFYGVGKVVERYAGEADFVNGCTINVYGNSADASSEETPCRPTNDYGRSRYAQERLIDYFCHRSGSRAIHVRYAHANSADSGIVRRLAEGIAAKKSLGEDPEARLQVIGLEDFVRVTAEAAERVSNPPAVVNCCHPHVWTKRELAESLHRRLGCGEVIFDAPAGGREVSAYATADRMLEWFGEPRVPLDLLLDRAAEAALAHR
jgi:nucleoside-diphosphate-sugar epimerase